MAPATTPPRQQTTIATGVGLTVIAWVVSRVVVGAAWGPARNPFTFDPARWTHWDSQNYLAIAAHGRTFGRCGGPGFPALSANVHSGWCGLAGWLPGYPWLSRLLFSTGLSLPDAALLISWAAAAAALFLVWLGWGRDLPTGRALVLLLLFGLFPGAVYNFALFPTSVALACVVGALVAATRGRFFVAALLMTGAGLCYPSAWFAAAGLAAGLVLVAIPLGAGPLVRRALWGVAGLGSLVVLGIHDQLAFGHAHAYLLVQSHPGLTPTGFPGQVFLKRFNRDVLAFQAVAAIALAGAAAAMCATRWLRSKGDGTNVYPALVGVAVIIGVVVAGHSGGWNRSVVLAAPCVVCLRRIPLPVLCAIVAVVGVTTALISRPFFTNYLV